MARSDHDTVDAYLAAQPAEARAVLERVRATIRKALPKVTERISYRIPTFDLDGTMVLFFAGFARHWSIYPLTPALKRELGDEIAPRLSGKTIRFSYDERFPAKLITRIAKVRAAENGERTSQPRKRAARSKR